MTLLAYQIACAAHAGQVDKGGAPYIEHPTAVANMLTTEDEKIVAYLHDVVEDTPITLADLKAKGFSEVVLAAVDSMTKRAGEAYDTYLARLCANPLAVKVKIADMTHNSDITRIQKPTQKDFARIEKYKKTLELLESL